MENKYMGDGLLPIKKLTKKELLIKSLTILIKVLLFLSFLYNLFFAAVHYYDNYLMRTSQSLEDEVMALSFVAFCFFLPIAILVSGITIWILNRFKLKVTIALLSINVVLLPYITYLITLPPSKQ